MTRKRVISTAVVLAVGVGILFGAWSQYLRPVKVQVGAVQRDVAVEVFGLGTVEARVTSKIGFKVSGVLVELHADVGDRVAKGAVLARLDDREQSSAASPGQCGYRAGRSEPAEGDGERAKGAGELCQRQQHQSSVGRSWCKATTTSVETARDGKGGRKTPRSRT